MWVSEHRFVEWRRSMQHLHQSLVIILSLQIDVPPPKQDRASLWNTKSGHLLPQARQHGFVFPLEGGLAVPSLPPRPQTPPELRSMRRSLQGSASRALLRSVKSDPTLALGANHSTLNPNSATADHEEHSLVRMKHRAMQDRTLIMGWLLDGTPVEKRATFLDLEAVARLQRVAPSFHTGLASTENQTGRSVRTTRGPSASSVPRELAEQNALLDLVSAAVAGGSKQELLL